MKFLSYETSKHLAVKHSEVLFNYGQQTQAWEAVSLKNMRRLNKNMRTRFTYLKMIRNTCLAYAFDN